MKENGEIDKFLNEQVLGDQDPIAQQRREFIDKYMLYKNGRTPSENIYDFLCELTGKEERETE